MILTWREDMAEAFGLTVGAARRFASEAVPDPRRPYRAYVYLAGRHGMTPLDWHADLPAAREAVETAVTLAVSRSFGLARSAPGAPLYCSFCGKAAHEVRKLVAGPCVFICDECSEIIAEMMIDPEIPGARP